MRCKTVVLIDGANIYATAKALGLKLDYSEIGKQLGESLLRAYYYTATIDNDVNGNPIRNELRPMLDWLEFNNFSVVQKEVKYFTDARGNQKVKGNMDMEIACDAFEIAPFVDEMYLFTGDGDFACLVKAMQRRGIRVIVVSSMQSQPPMAADELRRAADEFRDLADYPNVFGRKVSKYG